MTRGRTAALLLLLASSCHDPSEQGGRLLDFPSVERDADVPDDADTGGAGGDANQPGAGGSSGAAGSASPED